jgi:toxin ParE1/3/4
MSQYIISPEAMRDLEEIVDYYAMYNVDAGDRLLNEFNKKCRYLMQFPLMGRSYRQIRPYLQALPIQNYIIFYRVMNDGIQILRIIKRDRDFEAIFSEQV